MLTREVFRFPVNVVPITPVRGGSVKEGKLRNVCLKPESEVVFDQMGHGLGEVFEVIRSKMSLGDLDKPRAIIKAWDTGKKYRLYFDARTQQFVVDLYIKPLGEKNLLQTATHLEREVLLNPLQRDLELKGERPAIIKSYKEDALLAYRAKRQAEMAKRIKNDVDDYVKIALKITLEKPKEETVVSVDDELEVGSGSYQQRIANMKKMEEKKSQRSTAKRGRSRRAAMDSGKIPKRGRTCA